jgi:6-phosphogluconolactonase (cycloisomerase 2 family)
MEINQRMSKRFAWLFGVVVLISFGLLVACGSNYNPSSDGLVLVASQGSALIETFSYNLYNGHLSEIANTPIDTSSETCVLNGIPSSLVINPAGTYAYAILTTNSLCPGSVTGLQIFKINSDGNVPTVGSPVSFSPENVLLLGTSTPVSPAPPVVPYFMVMDPSGKFLFVADRATSAPNPAASGTPQPTSDLYIPGAISVFAIGSGGVPTEVAGSPFFTTGTTNPPTTLTQAGLDIVSVAASPTLFPKIGVNGVQNSACSTLTPPTTEYLYAVDGLGNQVFEFQVNTSTGVLTTPPNHAQIPAFATDQTPAGVAVDPCDRFVYVSDSLTNKVSAYSICDGYATQSSSNCPPSPLPPDGSLVQIAGSPISLTGSSNGPGPLLVDPYGNNVYVLSLLSNTVSQLKISPVSGSLSALTPATVATGLGPVAMAIRADDNWLFVSNYGTASAGGTTVSQYSITPATGELSVLPAFPTDNYPWGVAVK